MAEKSNSYLASFKKIFRYGINGGITTIVVYVLFVIISNIIDYRITIPIVYSVGIFLSYLLNRKTVFKVSGRLHLFIGIYVGMLLLNLAITVLLVEEFHLIKEFAQIIAVFTVFGIGYTMINRYAFPNQTMKK